MNYFSQRSAAERYARGRPHFHPLIVGRIKQVLQITEPLSSALDVGCGTGLSTVALKEIAGNVIGLDASAEMVSLAPEESGVKYVVASAERLPFGENEFDLITISQAFHWLDGDRFLPEASRVLRPLGWLVAYDNYFSSGRMEEEPEFRRWFREEYLERYPAPPRAEITFTEETMGSFGFHLRKEEWHENRIGFTLEGLIDYLVTQSNVIAAVEGGKESIEEARGWLREGIRPVFADAGEKEFSFNAPIWYLQRAA